MSAKRQTTEAVFDSARRLIHETSNDGELRIPTCITILWLRRSVGEYGFVSALDNDQDRHDLARALEKTARGLREDISEGFIPDEPPIKAKTIEAEEL